MPLPSLESEQSFICVLVGSRFGSFLQFSIGFWNCVVYFVLELFRRCGIFCFRTVPTVWYILFQNCSDSVVYFVLHFLSLKLLIIIYVFICASGILVRGEYHPSSSQCSDTDMVYQIYLFLTFTVLCNVIIIKSKVYRPSDIGHLLDFLLSTLVFELPIFF